MQEYIEEKSKDFLLESEKIEIEQKILEAVQEEHKVVDELNEKKKMTKAQLISEFIHLQESQGEIRYTEATLKKMTKADLIKKIANYGNDKISSSFLHGKNEKNEKNETEKKDGDKKEESIASNMMSAKVDNVDELMSVGLYNMNLCVIKVLETLGHSMKEQTKNINVLENLTNDIEERREAFLVIFKQIYLENKEVMVQYLTPVNQYFMLTSQCISTTVYKNIAKKKEKESDSV